MKSSTTRAARIGALALALVACTSDRLSAPAATIAGDHAALAVAMPAIRISEFHYDNGGTDVNERIEISGPAGASLAGWSIVRYNGSNTPSAAAPYTSPGNPAIGGIFADQCGGRGTLVFSYPQDGLQNGNADGFALVNAGGVVVEFLSYEGQITGGTGAAAGMVSMNLPVSEPGNGAATGSIQRTPAGDWTVSATENTFGACNDNDGTPPAVVASVEVTPSPSATTVGNSTTLTATARDAGGQPISGVTFTWSSSAPGVATVSSAGVATGVAVGTATITATAPNGIAGASEVTVSTPASSAANVRVSEFHYDNSSTDVDEKIELEGDVNGSLDGWKIYLYSGSPGSSTQGKFYGTINLAGTFGSACAEGTRGVLTFAAAGLQNGDNDGFAVVDAGGQVVEFLSYEGAFVAVDGPAAGMTATDVGVSEANAPAPGRSLQRAGNGTWFGPYPSTFDACNSATPPAPITGITFTGRHPTDDAPLPVGYQDQLFATLRDENTGASVPTTITWTSETPSVMTVDERGVITAVGAGSAVIRATAANGITNTTTLPAEVAPLADPSLYRDPLAFGTPTDGMPFDEIRIPRAQYAVSYSAAKGTPNWVAYHLSKATRGDLPGYRCDCFTVDAAVTPLGDPGISTADYTNSGFDRGHMVRSNDRELARGEQATTYYMTNIVPQYGNQNQGRWADLESYLQTVADGAGLPEVYIFAGPRGNAGTIANGRVVVPTHTWKVAVVLKAGLTPAQVDEQSDIVDVIAVDMPNLSDLPRDGNWQLHRTTVDAIEALAGYDLLSALPNVLEAVIESGDRYPTARISGAGIEGGNEGAALSFDGSLSSDPDVGGPLADVVGYAWTIGGVAAGSTSGITHTFADNGSYVVQLVVTDRFAAADTATTTIVVSNVAPTVNAFAGATILRGETYTASGSISDPGADSFTATVSYGEGVTSPLAVSGASFSLAHRYNVAGSYVVTVGATDDDSGVSAPRTATVTVLSAGQGASELLARINALEADGTLSKGEAQMLRASVANAIQSLDRGHKIPAAAQLAAFVAKVEVLKVTRRIPEAAARELARYGVRVLDAIN